MKNREFQLRHTFVLRVDEKEMQLASNEIKTRSFILWGIQNVTLNDFFFLIFPEW